MDAIVAKKIVDHIKERQRQNNRELQKGKRTIRALADRLPATTDPVDRMLVKKVIADMAKRQHHLKMSNNYLGVLLSNNREDTHA